MAAELERLDVMRREFVADASYDLRTPVANLAVAVEALREAVASSDASTLGLLEAIEREVDRLRTPVESLLDLSAIESGRVELHMVPVDLAEVAARAVASFRARVAQRGIALERRGPDRAVAAHADPERMMQVLGNLLDNALKFTPSGGRVTVTVAERRGQVVVSVEDTGPGILAGDLPHLFDRFFEADRSRTGRGEPGWDWRSRSGSWWPRVERSPPRTAPQAAPASW
ncbi:MAG: HAMP domain-containing sensor histidine kinase [Armatimonadota bacterium]|nr:HAMP domain-containing sensor histidine kinase [Armatimonadota bacterium]MDR7519365.1 HAMP domain-containing sensor histidine kinase [Armatimonadota bacterium]MDR7549512.1 HAMP domain-containing sensor histidine kinase [Armatimonadota bacterium]